MFLFLYIAGGLCGALFMRAVWNLEDAEIANQAYIALVAMLMIYVGAHLVSSDLSRIAIEVILSQIVAGIALICRRRAKRGLAALIILHAVYDFAFGHGSGIAAWYPPICVGFDVTIGYLLIARLNPSMHSRKND